MLDVQLFDLHTFLPKPYEEALLPRLKKAHEELQTGTGLGGEFTGWVHLPQAYDREEFARIQAAAKKIQSDSQALVVIGIGGSYLGARAVVELLKSPNYNALPKSTPDIYFAGNGISSVCATSFPFAVNNAVSMWLISLISFNEFCNF